MDKRSGSLRLLVPGMILLISLGCATTKAEDKKAASAHFQLGVSYLNDNNIQPAFVEFQKALELNPNDKETLNAIGLIYLLKLDDYPKAIDFFQRAVRVDKNFSEGWNNLGFAYEKAERYNDAVAAYKTALSNLLYQNAYKAFNNLGRTYYRLGKYSDAVEAYKEAIRRNSDFYLPFYGLALSYNAVGRYSDAAAALQKFIELAPEYKGDREKARRDLQDKKLIVSSSDEKDIEDLLEIMNY
ncbi:MAG TPA: tetratricopeptide repeat protein [Thermodesulfovibrionales bacterium]|nr:tetratricopeptide repeat protein [Thermodesulfovibrionales bacterium]